MAQRLDLLGMLQGDYRTPEGRSTPLGRRFPGAVFYRLMVKEVFTGSRNGKMGRLTTELYYRNAVGIFRAVEAVGGRIEVTGLDHIPTQGLPYVFVANHLSVLETFIMAAMIYPKGEHVFVVKKSLTEYPVFRHIMRSLDPIVVGRENPREDLETVLRRGVEKLQQGISIIIFPQRTRTAEFSPEKFNTIGIKLAKRAGVSVVPVALKTDFWGQGKLLKDFGGIFPERTVRFQFGAPLTISGKGQVEHEQIIRFIGDTFVGWERLDNG